MGSIPGSGRSPGERNGYPLQYSCLENPIDKKPGGLQPTGSQRVGHDWATNNITTAISWLTCWHHIREQLLAVRVYSDPSSKTDPQPTPFRIWGDPLELLLGRKTVEHLFQTQILGEGRARARTELKRKWRHTALIFQTAHSQEKTEPTHSQFNVGLGLGLILFLNTASTGKGN